MFRLRGCTYNSRLKQIVPMEMRRGVARICKILCQSRTDARTDTISNRWVHLSQGTRGRRISARCIAAMRLCSSDVRALVCRCSPQASVAESVPPRLRYYPIR